MDPITTALVAGAVSASTGIAKDAVASAYQGLKHKIVGMLAPEHQAPVATAITSLEKSPESAGVQAALASALQSSGVTQNADLLQMAGHLQQLAGTVSLHITDSAIATKSSKAMVVKGDVHGNISL
jgi:hypothetical protein